MPGSGWTVTIVTALCAPVLGFQPSSEVEKLGPETADKHLLEHHESCSGEMLWAARQFEMVLGKRRVDLLNDIFTDKGVVITKDRAGSPNEVLGGFLSSLKDSAIQEEAAFCANGDAKKLPKIAVRYRYTFETAQDNTTGTFLAQLLLEEVGQDMRIALAEIFSNDFAEPATEDMHHMKSYGGHQEACSQEVIDLVTGYVDALGARDHHTLAKMFTSDGYALSTSRGRSDPKSFFSDFLTTLEDARTVTTGLFCQMNSKSPMALARFDISYKPKGDSLYHQGVYIDQFAFAREHQGAPLKLKFVDMFENPTVNATPAKKDAFYLYWKHGATCSYEAVGLVRRYLKALKACDPGAATKLFAPEAVVETPYGAANAKDFYAAALAESSLGELVEEAAFCQESTALTGPSMSVRFHYAATHKGERHSSDFIGQFSFGRRDKDKPLQILKLELFKNGFNKAKPHPSHSSYLTDSELKNKVEQEEKEHLKFLRRHPEDMAGGCSSEAHDLVDAYFHALGTRDLVALQKILAPEATVMSPHTGTRLAVEFYSSILPMFKKVSSVKEEQFCEMYEKFGTVAVRSQLALDEKLGVIFTHFLFVRKYPHAPLQLSTIEIFDNRFIRPAASHSHHAHADHDDHGRCPEEAYALVDQYLIALATKNMKLMDEVFCEGGKVKSKGLGVKTAKDFFKRFLSLLSNVKVGHPTYVCDGHFNGPPTITVSFDLSYSVAGMLAKSKNVNTFDFVRVDTYAHLRAEMVHILQEVPMEHGQHKHQ